MCEDDKRLAAHAAADEVRSGMIVGIGTGSTAAWLIADLGERVRAGLDIRAVATSRATERALHTQGIPVIALDGLAAIDLAIDGVDEIDPAFRAIKGAGGAMLREKIVAGAARRMIAIADGSKRVAALGAKPVPVEILPLARSFVGEQLRRLGAVATLRPDYRTDQDNCVLDCTFRALPDPAALAAQLSAIPGLLGHGLFLDEIDAAYIADHGLVTRLERPR